MSLRIRRGTETERSGIVFDMGEIVWTTNDQQLWVGDGITQGGINILANSAGTGLQYNALTKKLEFAGASYTTDEIAEGTSPSRQYFTVERAQDAAAAALIAGVHTNISFVYNTTQDNANRIDATVTLDGVGIASVSADTNPSLGGNLTLNTHNITGTGNINITGSVTASSSVINSNVPTNLTLPTLPAVSEQTESDHIFQFGTVTSPATTWQYSANSFSVSTGLVDGTGANTNHLIRTSRGTLTAPQAVVAGDRLALHKGAGFDGTTYKVVGGYGLGVNPDIPVTPGNVYGFFAINLVKNSGGDFSNLEFKSSGVLSVPVLKVADAAGTLPSPAEAGMIVLDGSTFKGYNGSSWVVLG
ncbi:hypothetical protein UFOVP181_164 [uncultured Caudovirales phage]|uniref:Major tropism determinant N-terminal domain-containing protein n=1 Tax=uncultured Caudovirales phage TaxID=2100421 RepID=A0A6J7WED6_9CAUD|nr:hypothetical protein UFOVP57_475 [uncultured Caudovirales phage]CAB5208775.1 hypothetical protein UFOVP181_164 [uncultured Caudovirales phage]